MEVKREANRNRYQTAALIAAWVCMGMYCTLTNVALVDMRNRLGLTTEEFGRALSVKHLGGLTGGLFAGAMLDRFRDKTNLFVAISTLVCGCGTMLQPWSTYMEVLSVLFFIEGICQGLTDTAGNTYIMAMWGEKAGPPMHSIHFGFTVGCVFAPLIAFAFLSPDEDEVAGSFNSTTAAYTTMQPEIDGDKITIPYFIIGSCTVLLSVAFFVFDLKGYAKDVFAKHSKKKSSIKEILAPGSCAGGDTMFGVAMVAMFILYMILINGISIGPLSLGFTFLRETDKLDFTLEEATAWAMAASAGQMLGRGITIIISHWCPIYLMLGTEIALNAVSISLICFVGVHNSVVMWVATVVFAMSSSPLWPGGFSWLDQYITLYGIVVALATIGAGISGFVIQWLTGYLYEYVDEVAIFYSSMAASLSTVLLAVVMYTVAVRHGKRRKGDDLQALDSEKKDIDYEFTVKETITGSVDLCTKF
ncbi:hypothetical protein CAPTEDRAFT_186407 [Capitella teleta]|uniref:Major facilitator superfamily (MFS) profile domain-containing protein n=1 Tax=Capitella teleta TaxID=283909 RepID=R7U3E9_CAPTE|nr:hypothetical protein CAPTEDRAFT_186407 [Capitella teleta]|eukprot:ELU00484.1 hypothetical protein CAPTEDRAFT_186407 [Capitella teleta]